ncbi:MAG: multidrug transporter, partial [Akkermansiaceae bacterium]|nr:multidrug transporter [Akkermansiaceae bacterium]
MGFAEIFIKRPVATTLLTIALCLAGILAYQGLPVAPLPQVDFPNINVSASLPGASPETMATSVATPLERALGRIPGISEMTSSSSLGSTNINIQFDLDRDINGAANDVQAAINAARPLLPSGMPSNPNYRKANPADAPIMILSLTSESHTQAELYDTASTVIAQKISRLPGIGQVSVGGGSLPAVRVSLDSQKVDAAGVSMDAIRTTIASNNVNRPKGYIEDKDKVWQVTSSDQISKAADYLPMIVRYQDGAALRLSDLGNVVDSVQDTMTYGTTNGIPSVSLVLFREPGANILSTCDNVKALIPKLSEALPAAMTLNVIMERTASIKSSLAEVQHSLILAVILVVLVVWIFLRRMSAALIPGVAVPASLLGTFALMWVFGFSIDNLSLMALTIATGFVVDDAVVVLENITRHIEQGMPAVEAAKLGVKEVTWTVFSMSISLVAVFIPILFMGGVVGRLFREFAIVLSIAIAVSLVISLTTTPMMCARLLAHREGEKPPGPISRTIERFFDWLQRVYAKTLALALTHYWLTLFALVASMALSVDLYVRSPKGFFPEQDTGQIRGNAGGDQSISFQAMREKTIEFAEVIMKDPAVDSMNASTGGGGWGGSRNNGNFFISLKPLKERKVSAQDVILRLRKATSHIPGASLWLNPSQDIRIGGRASNASYQYTIQSGDLKLLRSWEPKVRDVLMANQLINEVNSDFQDKGGLTRITVDREKASRLGITMAQIDGALNNSYGQRQISPIYTTLNQYQVVLEIQESQRQDPSALQLVNLKTAAGATVALSTIATWDAAPTPLSVNHQGQNAAITFSFNINPGESFSEVTRTINEGVHALNMPEDVQAGFAGSAGAFQASQDSQTLLILIALVVIYLTLGILYESFLHPLTILSTLPSAGVGALLSLRLLKMDFDTMGFLGIFLLIGIVKKNAIMMIDFALNAERTLGLGPREAIMEACDKRLRPILMTTLAALFGALPLAIGFGEGSELRRPLGVSIVGGLILSQLLTLYTTPVVYLMLDSLRHR